MKRLLPWAVIVLLALADQVTKMLVLRWIPFQETIPVVPGFFSLTHVYNTGAAFGMLHDSNRFFIILSLVAFVALILLKSRFPGILMTTGWVLLLSGIIGNVTDRFLQGHVIDFLDFQFGSYHWPSFYVADSCICIAALLFLISSFQSNPITPKNP